MEEKRLLVTFLTACAGDIIFNNKHVWFPMFTRDQYLPFEWICENLLTKLNTLQSFNFGFFMVNYFLAPENAEVAITDEHYKYLKDHNEITWKIKQ